MKIQFKQPININKIAISGQCFRFTRTRSGWLYGDKPICQLSPTIIDFEYPELFDTETPYGEIEQAMLSRGGYWARCAQTGRGLMILNQPVFETILSFIISQNNNITRIQSIISNMCNPTFPSRDELLDWTVERWEELGVGYRARYLANAVQVCDDYWINGLKQAHNKVAYLKTLIGVGDKVANCIALFSLREYSSFPIDVHIKQIIDREFNGHIDLSWCKGYEGVVQQYMFYNELHGGRKMLESMDNMTLCGVIIYNEVAEEIYCDEVGQLVFETSQDGGCWCLSEINIGEPLSVKRVDNFVEAIETGVYGPNCVGVIFCKDGRVVVLLDEEHAVMRTLYDPLTNACEPFYYSADIEYEKED